MTDYGFDNGPTGDVPAEEAAPDPAPEAPPAPAPEPEPPTPALQDAVHQMRAAMEQFQHAAPQAPAEHAPPRYQQRYAEPPPTYQQRYAEPETYYDYEDPGYYEPGLDPDDPDAFAAAVEQIAEQRARAAVEPILEAQENAEFERSVLDLADRYPGLRAEGMAAAVEQKLDEIGARHGRDFSRDVGMIEQAFLAITAQNTIGAGGDTAAEQPRQGATLESGAGARPAREPEVDPQTRAYERALTGNWKPNKFGL